MATSITEASQAVQKMYRRAQDALAKQNQDYAVDLFLQVLSVDPELDDVRLKLRELQVAATGGKKNSLSSIKGMGKIMSVKGALKKDPAKALNLAEELLKLDVMNPAFLEAYCEAAAAADNKRAAATTLAAVVAVDTKNEALLEKLGHLYLGIGESKLAVDAFQQLGELRPGDQNVIKLIKDASARDTMKQGNWEEQGDFRGKLKDESEAAALEQESRSQRSESDLETIVRTQKMRLEAEPENLNLYRPLADNLTKLGEFDEALDVLERANEATGGADPLIVNAIAAVTINIFEYNVKVLREDGQEEAAQEQQAELNAFLRQDAADKVERYPNDLGYKFDYGKLLLEDGDIDGAIGQFQQSQRNPQRRSESLYYLGSAFKAKGLYDLAAGQLQTAAEEIPVMDEAKKGIIYELGEVLELQGKTEEAMGYFKQIFSIDIGYKDVAAKIEQGYTNG